LLFIAFIIVYWNLVPKINMPRTNLPMGFNQITPTIVHLCTFVNHFIVAIVLYALLTILKTYLSMKDNRFKLYNPMQFNVLVYFICVTLVNEVLARSKYNKDKELIFWKNSRADLMKMKKRALLMDFVIMPFLYYLEKITFFSAFYYFNGDFRTRSLIQAFLSPIICFVFTYIYSKVTRQTILLQHNDKWIFFLFGLVLIGGYRSYHIVKDGPRTDNIKGLIYVFAHAILSNLNVFLWKERNIRGNRAVNLSILSFVFYVLGLVYFGQFQKVFNFIMDPTSDWSIPVFYGIFSALSTGILILFIDQNAAMNNFLLMAFCNILVLCFLDFYIMTTVQCIGLIIVTCTSWFIFVKNKNETFSLM